jgi:hypothetical protein
MRELLRAARWLPALLGLVAGPASAQPAAGGAKHDARELAAKANDPTAPMFQLTFDNTFVGSSRGSEGVANSMLFQPVLPLGPRKHFPFSQVIRPSLPLLTTPGPDRTTGVGDVTLFDLFAPAEKPKWGSWGIGPVFVFPTGRDERLSAGKWQIGPAAALLYEAVPNLQVGAIVQNPISFAGHGDQPDVKQLMIQPIAQYNLPRGWYVSMGDLNWTFDWENGGRATIPLAFQLGRVLKIGAQHYNLSVEPFYTVLHEDPSPRWGVRFGFTLLLPE